MFKGLCTVGVARLALPRPLRTVDLPGGALVTIGVEMPMSQQHEAWGPGVFRPDRGSVRETGGRKATMELGEPLERFRACGVGVPGRVNHALTLRPAARPINRRGASRVPLRLGVALGHPSGMSWLSRFGRRSWRDTVMGGRRRRATRTVARTQLLSFGPRNSMR
jgi:hypothetical protein